MHGFDWNEMLRVRTVTRHAADTSCKLSSLIYNRSLNSLCDTRQNDLAVWPVGISISDVRSSAAWSIAKQRQSSYAFPPRRNLLSSSPHPPTLNGESRVCGIFFGWIMIAVHPAAARAVSLASFLFLPSAMSHQTILHLCNLKTNDSKSGVQRTQGM